MHDSTKYSVFISTDFGARAGIAAKGAAGGGAAAAGGGGAAGGAGGAGAGAGGKATAGASGAGGSEGGKDNNNIICPRITILLKHLPKYYIEIILCSKNI